MALPLRRVLLALLVGATCLATAQGAGARAGHAARRAFVPVLIYHHVKWLKQSDNAIERGLTVLPSQFEAELRYLASAHYHPITAARLVAYLLGGPRLPSKPVVLTFDDGYTDIYPFAYAALRRYRMAATFFIVPGFLDSPRYLHWSQVRDMARHGMDIEAHSMSHPDLTTVSNAQLETEVTGSRRRLERALHRSVRVFAYPYGAYDARVKSVVRRAGVRAAFTTHQGWWEDSTSLLTLPRVYVDIDDSLVIFRGRLVADSTVLVEDPV